MPLAALFKVYGNSNDYYYESGIERAIPLDQFVEVSYEDLELVKKGLYDLNKKEPYSKLIIVELLSLQDREQVFIHSIESAKAALKKLEEEKKKQEIRKAEEARKREEKALERKKKQLEKLKKELEETPKD